MLGGVCGGLAEHSGIDALIWRMGMVALTLAGGSGILVYVLLWVLMEPAPRGPQDPVSAVDQLAERLHTGLSGVVTPPRRD
jgi:phage shock protein PspC (stress-responsive transcriptional regulator)